MTLDDIKENIILLLDAIKKFTKESPVIVVLLGAGSQEIKKREEIAEKLEENNIIALIPEKDFPSDVSPSLLEEYVISKADVDLIFINVESWGTVTEFAQFHDKKFIAPKLRVLVPYKYHPIYGNLESYLTDLYLTHLTIYGHVYAYDNEKKTFPSEDKIILMISKRYQELKALGKI